MRLQVLLLGKILDRLRAVRAVPVGREGGGFSTNPNCIWGRTFLSRTLPVGGVSEPVTTNDGTVIVRVVERDEVTPAELQNGREPFREQLLTERRGRFFSSYMAKAKERMTIEIRDDVVRRMLAATATL